MRTVVRSNWSDFPLLLAGGVALLLWMAAMTPPVAQAQSSELLVETNVADATILVDGEEVGQTGDDGAALIEGLRPGRRTVEVRRTGYWSASARATLEPGLTTPVTLTLTARPGEEGSSLTVDTNVPGAVVEVDGGQVGQTGPDGRVRATGLAPGSHRIAVRKDGYRSASRAVTFDEPGMDRTIQLRLRPDAPPAADRAVAPTDTSDRSRATTAGPSASADSAAPSGAADRTTATNAEDSPRARAPGAGTGVSTPSDSAAAASTAASGAEAAWLLVDTGQADAQVAIDDSVYGQTGPEGQLATRAEPGSRQIAVRKEGFQTARSVAQLAPGEWRTLSMDLKPASAPSTAEPGGPGTGTTASGLLSQVRNRLPPSLRDHLLLLLVSLVGLVGLLAAVVGVASGARGSLPRWLGGGRQVDRYKLLEELRQSEFTTVYRADDPDEHRVVALKVLNDPYAERPDHVRPFLKTGHALQTIRAADPDAPVLEVYRVGRANGAEDGRPFVAYEHLQGDTLLDHLKDVGPLDTATALTIIRQVCLALRAVHEAGGHHGSVTPENILVVRTDPQVEVRLVGFGLWSQTQPTQFVRKNMAGNATAYVAPEQQQEGGGDHRSDMYAVGILFYRLVTGTTPRVENVNQLGSGARAHAGDSRRRAAEQQERVPRPELPDSVPGHVGPVFHQMMSTDPDRRPSASRAASVLDLIQSTA